jgi:hypothetical protein
MLGVSDPVSYRVTTSEDIEMRTLLVVRQVITVIALTGLLAATAVAGDLIFPGHQRTVGSGCTLNGQNYAYTQTVKVEVWDPNLKKNITIDVVCTKDGWRKA